MLPRSKSVVLYRSLDKNPWLIVLYTSEMYVAFAQLCKRSSLC